MASLECNALYELGVVAHFYWQNLAVFITHYVLLIFLLIHRSICCLKIYLEGHSISILILVHVQNTLLWPLTGIWMNGNMIFIYVHAVTELTS